MAKAPSNGIVSAKTGEIVNVATTDVASVLDSPMTLSQQAQSITLPNGLKISMARQVTMPLLKQRDGETVYLTILDKYFVGKQIKSKNKDEPPQKAAELLLVKSLIDQRDYHFIVPAVLKDVLDVDYKDGYVGKSFAIQKEPRQEGKRHKNLNIVEINVG